MNKKIALVKKQVVGVAARAARSMTNETNSAGWPPFCTGIFHQPKRPVRQGAEKSASAKK